MKKLSFHLLFLFIFIGVLAGQYFHIRWMSHIFKPAIMVWVGFYFLMFSKHVEKKVVRLALAAFVFSWFGDVLLMFGGKGFIYFMLGLFSFLLAQIFYIFLFIRTIQSSERGFFLKSKPFWLLPYLVYGAGIYILLFNHLDVVMKISVLVYMTALLSMSALALNRFGAVRRVSFVHVFAGSVLFMVSDTLIALNKFLVPVPHEGILIMSTYMLAQYFIMTGLLKQYEPGTVAA